MKKILVIDAQGGGIGKQLVTELAKIKNEKEIEIIAVGTNSVATAQMIKAGADQGATGENSVIVTSKMADVITGPVGIVIADSMLGEITDKMATAVGKSDACKVLIPINHCNNFVVGIENTNMKVLIGKAVDKIKDLV